MGLPWSTLPLLPAGLHSLAHTARVLVQEVLPPGSHAGFSGLHLPFIGFTFTTERCVCVCLPPRVGVSPWGGGASMWG